MISEIAFAVTYVVSPLYSNLPRRRVDDLAIELNHLLNLKIAPSWFPSQPFRGIHQRCFRVNGPYADPILYLAAAKSGINQEELINFLPKEELKIWIDPGEVTYQIGDQSSEVKCLFRQNSPFTDPGSPLNNAYNCFSNQSNYYISKSLVPSFTVSSFAKTKFGSTKLKSNSTNVAESVRPNSLKLPNTNNTSTHNAIIFNSPTKTNMEYTPDSSTSSLLSPNGIPNVICSTESATINIPCYLPLNVDQNSNAYSNLLTINIPYYSNSNGRESSGAGSLTSELNSPVHGY